MHHRVHFPALSTWATTASLIATLIVILILFFGVFVARTG
jgi:hypothetical protein